MLCPFATVKLLPQSGYQSHIVPTQNIKHSLTSPDIHSSWDYFNSPGAAGTEPHFLVGYDGELIQSMDTMVRADAEWDGNLHGISTETASNHDATDPWTAAQINTMVRLDQWLASVHPGIAPWICPAYDQPGYGYHRMFHQWNYSNHSCPGDTRAAQFPGILDLVLHPAPPLNVEDEMGAYLVVGFNKQTYLVDQAGVTHIDDTSGFVASGIKTVTIKNQADWDRFKASHHIV